MLQVNKNYMYLHPHKKNNNSVQMNMLYILYHPNNTQLHMTCKMIHLYIQNSSIDKVNKVMKNSKKMLENILYNYFQKHIMNILLDKLHMKILLLTLLESNFLHIANMSKNLRIEYSWESLKYMFYKYFPLKYPNKKLTCILNIDFKNIMNNCCKLLNKVYKLRLLHPVWIQGSNWDILLINCILYNFICNSYTGN